VERICNSLKEMQERLESVETWLRKTKRCYVMQNLSCVDCGRVLPMEAKKCHPCHNETLEQKYCTMETRVAEYFDILRKCELWPSIRPFQCCSVSDIAFRFACAKRDLKHDCAMASQCPLRLAVDDLNNAVHRIEGKVHGLCLQCVREERWNEKLCKHNT
jgi:hypothetical protein